MGLKNLFGSFGKAMNAKADKAADAIDDAHAVEFGKQDIEKMEQELTKVVENIATIKSEVINLDDNIKEIEAKVAKHESDAAALDAAGNEKLAIQNCEAADRLEAQAASLRESLVLQKELEEDQIEAKDELKQAIEEAKSELVSIKAMTDVADANARLTKINTASGDSALANFKKRKENAKKKMLKAKILKEESGSESSLESQTTKALNATAGNSRLERLRKK